MVKSTVAGLQRGAAGTAGAEAKLLQKTTQLEGLSRKVYAGEELSGLADITPEALGDLLRRAAPADRGDRAEAALAEQQRLARAARTPASTACRAQRSARPRRLRAQCRGERPPPRHRRDSLAALVDCEQASSSRSSPTARARTCRSAAASRSTASRPARGPGTVTEILPKTSDKADAAYAVPFPQTERRELYVLVKPDPVTAAPAATGHAAATNSCGVGRWVSVTREAGWVPSTSMLWRSLGDHAATLTTRAGTVVTAALKPFAATPRSRRRARRARPAAGRRARAATRRRSGWPRRLRNPSPLPPRGRPRFPYRRLLRPSPTPRPPPRPRRSRTCASDTVPLPPQRPQEFTPDSAEPKRARREQRAER